MSRRIVILSAMSLLTAGCSVFGIRGEETPEYKVVRKDGSKEIREYSPYIVATTTVAGRYSEAQTKAFRILAGYIFGKNKGKKKIAMTAPVLQESADLEPEKIAMTAPVMQERSGSGWQMAFMMPSKYKMKDLPEPEDQRISFQQIPAKTLAVIRYSWSRSRDKNEKMAKHLSKWLENKGEFIAKAEPVSAGYDPPWTLPFFRRNEILIEVEKKR